MRIQTNFSRSIMPSTLNGGDYRCLSPIVEGADLEHFDFDVSRRDRETLVGPLDRMGAITVAALSGAVIFPGVQLMSVQAKIWMNQDERFQSTSMYCLWSLVFAGLAGAAVGANLAMRGERQRPWHGVPPRLNDLTLAPLVAGCVLGFLGSVTANLAVHWLTPEHADLTGPRAVAVPAVSFGGWCGLMIAVLGAKTSAPSPV